MIQHVQETYSFVIYSMHSDYSLEIYRTAMILKFETMPQCYLSKLSFAFWILKIMFQNSKEMKLIGHNVIFDYIYCIESDIFLNIEISILNSGST